MTTVVNLYSEHKGEINNFLNAFYNTHLDLEDTLKWEKEYYNPIEMSEIIGAFIDNKYKYNITMWISLDKNIFINVTEFNANPIIKYLFERFPY